MVVNHRSAGFTLIEVLTATFLFALIGMAGLVLITSISRVSERTSGRLDDLAEIERAWLIVTRDVERAIPGTLRSDGTALSFERTAPAPSPAMFLRYDFADQTFIREAGPARQRMVTGLAGIEWDFLDRAGEWHDHWPPGETDPSGPPAGLSVTLTPDPAFRGRSGAVRRVVIPPQGQEP